MGYQIPSNAHISALMYKVLEEERAGARALSSVDALEVARSFAHARTDQPLGPLVYYLTLRVSELEAKLATREKKKRKK